MGLPVGKQIVLMEFSGLFLNKRSVCWEGKAVGGKIYDILYTSHI